MGQVIWSICVNQDENIKIYSGSSGYGPLFGFNDGKTNGSNQGRLLKHAYDLV